MNRTSIYSLFTVQEGKKVIPDREKINLAIKNLPDGVYSYEIKRLYARRTNRQNRAAWGVAEKILRGLISTENGEEISKELAHEIIMEKCLPDEYVEQLRNDYEREMKHITSQSTGEIIALPFRLTTTRMSTIQWNQYYLNMQRFAAEFFGYNLKDPDPDYFKK